MQKIKYLSMLLIFTVISCSSNYEEEESNKVTTNTSTNINVKNNSNNTNVVTQKVNTSSKTVNTNFNKKVEKRHAFSRPDKSDLFQLTLSGKDINKADINFKIISYNGKTIYNQNFKSDFLIGFGPDPKNVKPLTQKQQSDFIIKRTNEFFADSNFKKPAILNGTNLDPNYSDPKIWNTIKADKTAIGFYYLLGKEDGRYIAYDKKTNKVVMYLNCC